MDAKAYLSQAKRAEREIGALRERRLRCAALGEGCPAGAREALAALEGELERRAEAYAGTVRGIEAAIDGVEEAQYREVLRYRYLNGWDWRRIAVRLGCSREWAWRLHARALEAVEKRLGNL